MKNAALGTAAIIGSLLLTMGCNSPRQRYRTGLLSSPNTVNVADFRFDPESLSITRGDTVTWIFFGLKLNTPTSGTDGVPDGRWDSPPLDDANWFQHTFDSTGIFPYYSRPHYDSGMLGWILVRE